MGRHRDATEPIEQLEVFEDRLGVRFEGLFAPLAGPDSDGDFVLEVNGEVHAQNGTGLDQDTQIVLSAHDSAGRVVAKASHYLDTDGFFGFEAFSFYEILKIGDLSKIRLYPKTM